MSKTTVLRILILEVFVFVLNPLAFGAEPPNAGTQIQQISPPPNPQKAAPEIRLPQSSTPDGGAPDHSTILVKTLHVSGQVIYSEAELLALTDFKPGRELSLAELRKMAAKIANFYHRHGYLLAQAYIPAQGIEDGVVTIAVLEGKYGKVTLNNRTNLSDSLASELFEGVKSGDAVAIAPLESGLLLLSDIPGVNVKSTLAPGASIGTSDLLVEVTPGLRVRYIVDADNEGNRYTGRNRIGTTISINDPTGHGDALTLRGQTSGSGLNYARASYQAQISKATLGLAYAALKYRLGNDFASLQANGTAQIVSLYGSYPVLRSRNNNLYLQLDYDAKTFQDRVDVTATVTDKKTQSWMSSINGDHKDGLGRGGLSKYSLTWTSGNLDILSALALATDMATVKSNGHYDKLGLSFMRLQSVTETVSIYAAMVGQVASKNLDTSEKIGLGGANGVRAYPEGEAYGDQGYLLNLEVRKVLPKFSERMSGQVLLIAFADTGSVTLNKTPWSSGQNRRTLSGTGIGVNWINDNDFILKAYYAHKVGNAKAVSAPDEQNRFWIQGIKYF